MRVFRGLDPIPVSSLKSGSFNGTALELDLGESPLFVFLEPDKPLVCANKS